LQIMKDLQDAYATFALSRVFRRGVFFEIPARGRHPPIAICR
jgi:hypothetical protein